MVADKWVKFALKAGSYLLFAFWCFIAPTLLFFTVLEIKPDLLNYLPVENILYYANKKKYISHDTLIYEPREKKHVYEKQLTPNIGFDGQKILYTANYNENGFRVNSSKTPSDLVFIGDSFIEIGENDNVTITEYVARETGLSVYNMGRSGYCPYQYVEVLKEYGLAMKPQYAVMCFFAGNDIRDMEQFNNWLNGGNYYRMGDSTLSFFKRYYYALSDAFPWLSFYRTKMKIRAAEKWILQSIGVLEIPEVSPDAGEMDPDELLVQLPASDRKYKMYLHRRLPAVPVDELRVTDEFVALQGLIKQFKGISEDNGIIPLLLYIPDKYNIYQRYVTDESSSMILPSFKKTQMYAENDVKAIDSICEELSIPMIDLLPGFQKTAEEGKMLYYWHDGHWNDAGVKEASRIIAQEFEKLGIKPRGGKRGKPRIDTN